MDIDCDGENDSAGACQVKHSDRQPVTAFRDTVKGFGIPDLNANIHTYVVFGDDHPVFDPTKFGMVPLSVMAVVCNNQLVR